MVSKAGLRAGIALALVTLVAAAGAGPAWGHEQHKQGGAQLRADQSDTLQTGAAAGSAAAEPFPADIGGAFELIDQTGKTVTDADFHGRYMLVFFGYAQCDGICPVSLKRMTRALDLLEEDGEQVQPIFITVDPENDTPAALAAYLPTIHPRLIGLTGTPEAVHAAMKSYKVNANPVGQSWKGTQLISHGSYIYLMGPDGALLTVIPPVFSPPAMAGIIQRYLDQS